MPGDAQRPALIVIVRHAESARNQTKKGSVYFADDAARRVVRGTLDRVHIQHRSPDCRLRRELSTPRSRPVQYA
jgi:hypothetical protein